MTRVTLKGLLGLAILSVSMPVSAQLLWKVTNLGPGGDYCAIALDSADHPHFSYLDDSNPSNFVLRHAFFDGKAWRREIVDSGDVGWWSSIAVDSQDRPHIAYHADKPSSSLKYAYFDGTSWQITVVDEGGYSTAITLDADDNPHISYTGNAAGTEARYARLDGANWDIETIASNAFYSGGTSIALSPSGDAHLTFSDSSLPRKLYWATNESGDWVVSYLDDGTKGSLALYGMDLPRVMYVSETAGALKYARYNGSSWTIDQLQPGDSPSLKVDSHDRAQISFVTQNSYVLGFSKLVDLYNWETWFLAGPGFFPPTSIALDSLGLPHVAARKLNSAGASRLAYFQLRLPDLKGNWAQISRTPIVGGELVTGFLVVKNEGNRNSGGVNVKIYLSDDLVFDAGDELIGKPFGVGKIGAGKNKVISLSHTSATPLSGKFLVAVIDDEDRIYEIQEQNNEVPGTIP